VFVCGIAGLAVPALACINTFESEIRRYRAANDEAGVAAEIAKLESEYREAPTLEHTNDLGVGRLLTSRYPEAIKLFEEAERRFPGKAIVAANLGTAYELSGNLPEAFRWISEGVKRDPKEHQGSEWLHVKILEAKIAVARDPEWLKRNTVLGVSFGDQDIPVMPTTLPADEAGRPRTPDEIYDAIYYQLYERTKFVGRPDAFVADLYAAQGDLSFAAGKLNNDDPLGYPPYQYDEALSFEPAQRERVERRQQKFNSLYDTKSWYQEVGAKPAVAPPVSTQRKRVDWPWIGLVPVLGLGAAWILRRHRLTKP